MTCSAFFLGAYCTKHKSWPSRSLPFWHRREFPFLRPFQLPFPKLLPVLWYFIETQTIWPSHNFTWSPMLICQGVLWLYAFQLWGVFGGLYLIEQQGCALSKHLRTMSLFWQVIFVQVNPGETFTIRGEDGTLQCIQGKAAFFQFIPIKCGGYIFATGFFLPWLVTLGFVIFSLFFLQYKENKIFSLSMLVRYKKAWWMWTFCCKVLQVLMESSYFKWKHCTNEFLIGCTNFKKWLSFSV